MERTFGSMSQPPKATVANIVDSSGMLVKSPDVAGTSSTAFKKSYPDMYKGVSLAETLAQTSANSQRVQNAYDYLNKNNGAVAGLDAQMKIDNSVANSNNTVKAVANTDTFRNEQANRFVNSIGKETKSTGLSSMLAAADKPIIPVPNNTNTVLPSAKSTVASNKPRVYDAETNRILADLKSRGTTVQQQIAANKATLKDNYAKNMYVEEPTVIDNN